MATVVAGLLVGDSFLVFPIVQVPSLFALGLWLVVLILRFLWHLLKKRPVHYFKQSFLIWLFAIFLLVIFSSCGQAKSEWRCQQAENFVAFASQQLDAEKKLQIKYPEKLPFRLEQQTPDIVQYYSDGKTYYFSYNPPLPLGLEAVRKFDSNTHSWHTSSFDP